MLRVRGFVHVSASVMLLHCSLEIRVRLLFLQAASRWVCACFVIVPFSTGGDGLASLWLFSRRFLDRSSASGGSVLRRQFRSLGFLFGSIQNLALLTCYVFPLLVSFLLHLFLIPHPAGSVPSRFFIQLLQSSALYCFCHPRGPATDSPSSFLAWNPLHHQRSSPRETSAA